MRPVVLVMGGHDPTGGAGIQADIETIAVLGGHAITVPTALTLQNSHQVESFDPAPLDRFIQQSRMLLEEFEVVAIKIGMVGSLAICEAIHTLLNEHPAIPVVLDPVLAAGGGGALSQNNLIEAIRTLLIPRLTLATPNRNELRKLAPGGDNPQARCAELLNQGCQNLLVTGTDEPAADENVDQVHHLLLQQDGTRSSFQYKRLPHRYHGSGCTLASAITLQLGKGGAIEEAVKSGLDFTWNSLKQGHQLTDGQHFPNRFFNP
ncbi:MAG: hydroxymethylpyrimidine/phosphomethylpyrimidine kinase [Gammaproteobacteria bacterium]|nr:hydroxymethylpyrimidine/phosphomethylpyrimidine kinase [Gammaproteobacteria bacterium]MBT3843850.1 hydroxymethylpyrimidine/phosphomethylpyrimidine kinase [Gammaproteobacteria bacterium]MBT3892412.1 hydroxymethylpyrimidine/phosphomethylpyrimidine kinase [Gammaproteobacteria bacterium]MBT4299991.1 hydroxymethylpyrimidine/phosphomethylpyrimidine kinase [Gammaproteobacteria bacterium]MBT4788815.1 hydroxymethylpyrimidine/phosphomethylpyrimidine kinase [Gammaproteobacteria bacterium]